MNLAKEPTLFVDTSAWYAYINAHDARHHDVCHILNNFAGQLLSSEYIFDEIVTLCRRRLGHDIAVRVGEVLLDPGIVELLPVEAADFRAAWQLLAARRDKIYSFTDCTSFELMRRCHIKVALSLDADFEREGFSTVP